MRKSKLTLEQYHQIFRLYEKGYSFQSIIEKLNLDIDKSVLSHAYNKYINHGVDSLLIRRTNHTYTAEFKKKVIEEHLVSGKSMSSIAAKYNIPSRETVRKWIIKYTEGKENKNYSPIPEVYSMKSKNTTLEERIEIVKYCLNNGLNYKETAKHFNIKYSQIYAWVKKYREHGESGLYDGRGKGKPTEILSTEEQLKLKIKELQSKNKFLEMENEALKKKKQIERQLMNQKYDT